MLVKQQNLRIVDTMLGIALLMLCSGPSTTALSTYNVYVYDTVLCGLLISISFAMPGTVLAAFQISTRAHVSCFACDVEVLHC